MPRDLRQRPGEFDAGRAAADDDKGEQRTAQVRILGVLSALERLEDSSTHFGRVLQRLQARRMTLPVVVAEKIVLRAGGEDQRVVAGPDVTTNDLPSLDVEVRHVSEMGLHVPASFEHAAQRRSDVRRRQTAGRDLVKQRLEQVEVAAVDQRDLEPRGTDRLGGVEPAESAADDDDALACAAIFTEAGPVIDLG